MRALRFAGACFLALVGLGWGAWWGSPALARRWAGERGVAVELLGWCPEARPWSPALCGRRLRARGVEVDALRLDASGEVLLAGIRAPWSVVKERLSTEGPTEGAASWRPSRLRVRDLRIADAPLELPSLRGELIPAVRLEGEGLRVEGRTVEMRLPTRWGAISLRARPEEGPSGSLRVEAQAAELVASFPELGEAPVRLRDVRVEGSADPESRTFAGSVHTGGVSVRTDLLWGARGLEGTVELPPTPFARVISLWSEGVPEAGQAQVEGTIAATVRGSFPDGPLDVQPAFEGLRVRGLVGPSYARGSFTYAGSDASGGRVTLLGGEGSPGWRSLGEIGPWLPAAVIAAEDGGFRGHPGYDLASMREAAEDNASRGTVWRGGSTLTQQLAKNLFLDGRRTYGRKLRELLYAVDLEGALGKDRILELYLNVAEWGPGLRGAAAAAEAYFARSPSGLLPEEAAWLASILPMPRSAWTQQYLAGAPQMARVSTILENMKGLPEEEREAALQRRLRFVPPTRAVPTKP